MADQKAMQMIHTFEDFCAHHDRKNVFPDVTSRLGRRSVECLRKSGWAIGAQRPEHDLLALCRESEENFKLAYTACGIDFWVRPD